MGGSPAIACGPEHVVHAFDALLAHLAGQPLPQPAFEDATCPLFVTWHSRQGETRLRGCIGTLEPRQLHAAVADYALTSARDRRFAPISAAELRDLRCTVSLLHSFERAASWEDWEIGVHGITIEFADPHTGARRSATFLPEVAAHERWDHVQTLDHLVRKAGFAGPAVTVRSYLQITRYQSTACSLTYEEYARLKQQQRSRLPRASKQKLISVPA
eukprot:scaffold27.g6014.t1